MPEAQYTAELSEAVPKPTPFRLQWHVLIGWVVIRSTLESATQFAPRKEVQIIALLLTGLGDLVVTIRQTARVTSKPEWEADLILNSVRGTHDSSQQRETSE